MQPVQEELFLARATGSQNETPKCRNKLTSRKLDSHVSMFYSNIIQCFSLLVHSVSDLRKNINLNAEIVSGNHPEKLISTKKIIIAPLNLLNVSPSQI